MNDINELKKLAGLPETKQALKENVISEMVPLARVGAAVINSLEKDGEVEEDMLVPPAQPGVAASADNTGAQSCGHIPVGQCEACTSTAGMVADAVEQPKPALCPIVDWAKEHVSEQGFVGFMNFLKSGEYDFNNDAVVDAIVTVAAKLDDMGSVTDQMRFNVMTSPFEFVRDEVKKQIQQHNPQMMDKIFGVTEDSSVASIQNGYGEQEQFSVDDLFPSGAASNVLRKAGPASSTHGDNPLQKAMFNEETKDIHKSLVYKYRSFLTESEQGNQKKR